MQKSCKYCGKKFETKKGHNNQMYCCKSCSVKDRHVEDIGLFREEIDDYIKKYVLGLIITDGCLSKNGERVFICISLKDFKMIERIRDLVCPNKKVYKDGNNYQVKWRNENDVKYLNDIGIHERKTFDVVLPMFNENMWHLIRGIFDGDGCVYYSTTFDKKMNKEYTYAYVTFTTASEKFAYQLNKFLNQNNITSKIYIDKRNSDRKNLTFYIKIFKKESVLLFRNLIYQDCNNWYLERKYNKFYNKPPKSIESSDVCA